MNYLSLNPRFKDLAEGMGPAVEFWTLEVDNRELTTTARPFSASDSEIILNECEECYCCGKPQIIARRSESGTVMWFPKLGEDRTNQFEDQKCYEFDLASYEELLGGCASELKLIAQDDFEHLLPWFSPHYPDEALYTEPELPNDKFGKQTLRIFYDTFRHGAFKCSSVPIEFRTLRVGLDQANYPESVIQFGMVEQKMAFRFEENPYVPVWMEIANNENPFAKLFKFHDLAKPR